METSLNNVNDTKLNPKKLFKHILKFKAPPRSGGTRSPFSLLKRQSSWTLLKAPPKPPMDTSAPPPPPLSPDSEAKRHPTVKTEPDPWDIHDYPAHPTCVDQRSLDIWKREDIQAVKKSEVGSAGVLFVRHKDGIIVLKACGTLGQELFGAGLAEQLGVRVPAMRVVDDEEFKAIAEALLPKGDPTASDFGIIPFFDNLFMVVMEFAPGHSLEQLETDEAEYVTSDLVLQQIGSLMVLDVVINNSDRLPFGSLWSNDGNLGNVLIQATDDSGNEVMCLFGIDNRAMTITDENLLEKHSDKLKENLEDLFTKKLKSPVIENITQLINKEFGIMNVKIKLTEKHQEQIHKGMIAAVKDSMKITPKNLEDLYQDIHGYVNEDNKEEEWAKLCKDLEPSFHSKIVSLIQNVWKKSGDQSSSGSESSSGSDTNSSTKSDS